MSLGTATSSLSGLLVEPIRKLPVLSVLGLGRQAGSLSFS